jgi:hypothetical protein
MTELPRTDDPPRAGKAPEGARVDEAVAAFTERVRDLEGIAGELREELRALRAERSAPRYEDEVWPAEPGLTRAGLPPSPDWVAAVPPPLRRALAVPRLALEAVFLLLVALLAGLADLSAASILIVMAAAWALVALAEWAAAQKRARWRLDEIAPGLGAADGPDGESTGPWSMPIVHATVVEAPDVSESRTIVAKLPADPEAEPEEEADAEVELEPTPKRSRLRRRKAAAEQAAPDPWET